MRSAAASRRVPAVQRKLCWVSCTMLGCDWRGAAAQMPRRDPRETNRSTTTAHVSVLMSCSRSEHTGSDDTHERQRQHSAHKLNWSAHVRSCAYWPDGAPRWRQYGGRGRAGGTCSEAANPAPVAPGGPSPSPPATIGASCRIMFCSTGMFGSSACPPPGHMCDPDILHDQQVA